MHSQALSRDPKASRKPSATSFFAQKKRIQDAPRRPCQALEEIPDFRLGFPWHEGRRRLEALGVRHDPNLLLARFAAAMSALMRMVRSRLRGQLWFTHQEFHQAALDAERVAFDRRTTPFGEVATRKWLTRMVGIGVLLFEAAAGRYYVRDFQKTHRGAFERARLRHAKHLENDRLRYHIRRDHDAPEDTRDAQFGFCADGLLSRKPGGQTAQDMASTASLGLFADSINTSRLSNHSGKSINLPSQPSLPTPIEAHSADVAETSDPHSPVALAGSKNTLSDCQEAQDRAAAHEILSLGYGADTLSLGPPHKLDRWAVDLALQWLRRHGTDPAAAQVLARRHKALKRQRPGASEARQRPEDPRPPRLLPLRAQPLALLPALVDEHLAHARRVGLPRYLKAAHLARVSDVGDLIGALRAPAAEPRALQQFWQGRPWLGRLAAVPPGCRPASIELWHYAAARMEVDRTCETADNPAGLLVCRVRAWVEAQTAYEVRHVR